MIIYLHTQQKIFFIFYSRKLHQVIHRLVAGSPNGRTECPHLIVKVKVLFLSVIHNKFSINFGRYVFHLFLLKIKSFWYLFSFQLTFFCYNKLDFFNFALLSIILNFFLQDIFCKLQQSDSLDRLPPTYLLKSIFFKQSKFPITRNIIEIINKAIINVRKYKIWKPFQFVNSCKRYTQFVRVS